METIDRLFGNYGSEHLARVFKSYWSLLLLMKQVTFSLFLIGLPIQDQLPVENTEIIKEVTVRDREENLNNPNFFRLIVSLAQVSPNEQFEKTSVN
ncbi:hypothetical protein [Salinimicrobium xinjiangense]|uniref:hypothetical protein n=1 Tax=Salinimicrobium xinjiangense TaxID=438596 RepID=UPI0004109F9D|nr:hypothetical protein [Salinimicrobium xinjiangense]